MDFHKNQFRIRDYFHNKTVFITGGSGFVGKVLIEKLLRSCPGIRKIYVLLRPKNGFSVEERMNKIFCPHLFATLDEDTNGAWMKKIQFIDGNVMKLHLGISKENEKMLTKEVNIFYHTAASIKFDDSLKVAVLINARGAREACNLALKMKNIEMFCHVSTTYCNLHMPSLEEVILPPVANWEEMIYLAEHMDEYDLQLVSTKLMDQFPNTYTFSKNLAEHIVNDLCNEKVPSVIIRPSIVVSTVKDPVAGWTDNFNGPSGMLAACAKGLMHVYLVKKDLKLDLMPVDYLVKFMMFVVYYRKITENAEFLTKLQVYNVCSDLKYAITIRRLIEIGNEIIDDIPLANPIWYPSVIVTSSKLCYYVLVVVLQLFPAILIDAALKLSGAKPMLFKIQKKMFVAKAVVGYFLNTDWNFVNEKMLSMLLEIKDEDKKNHSFTMDVDQLECFWNNAWGFKMLLLKEDLRDLEKHRKRLFQMKILHYVTKTLIYMLLIYFIYNHLYVVDHILQTVLKSFWHRLQIFNFIN